MRPAVKSPLRILIGMIAGAICGSILSFCLLTFAIIACVQITHRGPYPPSPTRDTDWENQWYSKLAVFLIVAVPPLTGAISGVVLARRRNQRVESNVQLRLEESPGPGEPAA